jgi:Cd2+/Zn2+-exporting ATPase
LAEAIVRAATARAVAIPEVRDFRAETGAGVRGVVEEREIAVLKPSAAAERGIRIDATADAWRAAAEARGETAVIVVVDGRAAGVIALGDTIRPHAAALVTSLRRAGVEHVVMLSGDAPATARSIARLVGIEEVHGGLLPQEKVAKVRELLERYGSVAMVGDGVNDAPALAAASVGVAMGIAGSDAALAAADVALMADDLSKVEYAVELGRRSTGIIRQNVVASLVVVVALVTGVFAADLSMFAAVVGHEGSELLIILNGLRAAR